ncbi:FecR family protein [Chitinophaga niabensis]|nr:FecR domain-containing protein [Chitinophaga niabensis]
MTLKLSGLIDAEEEVWLDNLIKNDPVVQLQWNELLNAYNPKDIDTRFARYNKKPWKAITTKNKVFTIQRALVAAAIIGVCALAASWLFQPKRAAVVQSHGIVLKLSNGETLQLSGTPGTITMAGTQFSKSGNSMSYTAGNEAPGGWNSLTVPIGMDYKIDLPDGSQVWMNSATTLDFPFRFSASTREIKINGEAYLKIAPDVNRPFIVQAGASTVQVLGTEFNVNTYDPKLLKIALVEGAIKMKAGNQELQLSPGQEAIWQNTTSLASRSFDAEEVLGWRKGIYYFNNASLHEITEVLPRWFGIAVVMDRADVGKDLFSGLVNRNKPIHTFLENLKSTTAIDYYFDKEGVLHFK